MLESVNSRQAILDAAKRLFAEQGFRAISMRLIADAVGISKAAIYYHFKDKEELFLAILESYLADLATLIDEAAGSGDTFRAKIHATALRILTQPAEQRAVLRLASQELNNLSQESRTRFLTLYHEQFIGRITILLESGMAAGELRLVDSKLATWTLLGMMYPYSQTSFVAGLQPTHDQIEELLAIYFDGIGMQA